MNKKKENKDGSNTKKIKIISELMSNKKIIIRINKSRKHNNKQKKLNMNKYKKFRVNKKMNKMVNIKTIMIYNIKKMKIIMIEKIKQQSKLKR